MNRLTVQSCKVVITLLIYVFCYFTKSKAFLYLQIIIKHQHQHKHLQIADLLVLQSIKLNLLWDIDNLNRVI